MNKILLFAFLLLSATTYSQLKFTYVSPSTNEIKIKNFGASAVDITNYRLCALFEYANLVEPTVAIASGSFNLAPDAEVLFTWDSGTGFNPTSSDLGLYLPTGSFSSAANMVDFMEYGGGGQGRENVANTAGLWTAGTFLTGTGPWYYIGDGSASGLAQWSTSLPLDPYTGVRINEVDPDQPSTDMDEFIELYGIPNTTLDGLVMVFFSGAPSDLSYSAYDLDGQSLDANGFFVLGSATVPNVDMLLTGAIQNGADGIAIYVGDATDWASGTPASATNIVDAIVYGSDDTEDVGLIATLTPGQAQLNDSPNTGNSFSRLPDGGAALDISNYFVQAPTPGITNVPLCSGAAIELESGELSQCSELENALVVLSTNSLYGDNYIYILSDASDIIITSDISGSFEMDGQPDGDFHLWGFSYNGILDLASIATGQPTSGVISNSCYSLSTNFITVTRAVCTLSNCDGGTVLTSDGNSYVSLCSDVEADIFEFTYTTTGNADGYEFILADANGLIVQMLDGVSFDFNTLPIGDYFVHGLSYFTGLDPNTIEPGDPLTGLSTLGACLDLSDNSIEVHVLDCTLGEGCTRLFISEYFEGTSNNKAIELYNPTPFPVDLSDYDMLSYANGSIDFTAVVALAGTIQPGSVYVIANSQADAAILAEADMTANIATFNGNDALVLTQNLVPIDIIGVIGVDPGAEGWQFGQNSTVDHDLVRNVAVNSPTMNWDLSQGQWISYAPGDFSHLGNHNAVACSGEAFVSFEVTALQVEETAGVIELTIIAFNISVDVPITVDISASSATAGSDFINSFPLTLTFTPTNNSQIVSIEILDDLIEENQYEYITISMNDDDDLASFVNQSVTISIEPSDQDFPLYTIAEISTEDGQGLADSLNVFCSITGIVHGINFNPAGTEFTLIDGTGGIKIFDADENYGYPVLEGDSIVVYGQVAQFMGMTQLFPSQIIYVDGNHELEVPSVVTILDESNESHIVKIECVSLVDPLQWTQVSSGFDVDVLGGEGVFKMHIDLNTDIYSGPYPEGHFTVVGIGAQQDPNSPYDGDYVFWPTALTDFTDQLVASFEMPSEIVYGDAGETVDFVNNSSNGADYLWDFGDGNNSNSQTVSHDYDYSFLSNTAEVTVSLIVSNATCADTMSTTVDVTYTAIEWIAQNTLQVFPNPAVDYLIVKDQKAFNEIRITDTSGRLVLHLVNNGKRELRIDLSALQMGLYQLEVIDAQKTQCRKILIN